MDLGVAGRVAVVTGASTGIGLATAGRLAAEGAQVLLVARNEARLRAAATQTGAAGWLAVDVTDDGAPARIADRAEELGGTDILVNNAGTSFVAPLEELTDGDWRDQYELHVVAPMRLMRVAAPRMAARGWGRIVTVASSSGKRPSLTNAAYSVTKAAALSLSRVFADRYAAEGVLVNAVTPGATGSGLWRGDGGLGDQVARRAGISRDEALARQAASIPLGRLGEPGEIADVIAFLCSARASNVTGAAWSADGGSVNIII